MAKALLIQDFGKVNNSWIAREYNEAIDAKAAQQIPINVLTAVIDELEAEARETASTHFFERQRANYPVRTSTQKIALGHPSRHGKIVTNKSGLQSYLRDGKIFTFAGQPKKIADPSQMVLPLEYLETPEPAELDVDYMRKKWLEADTPAKKKYWLNIGNFAVMLNSLKTQQEVEAVELPTDPFLNLRYAELKAQRLEQVPGEHQLICHPDFSNLEGMEAVSKHLGEKPQPKPHLVKGQKGRFLSGATGLSNLDKQIYYEAQFTAQGDAVLPHEDRSKRPWFKYAGGVKAKFGCTTLQAEELYTAFNILDTTAAMAKTFAEWIEKRGVEKAVTYFRSLAIPLMCVTDINEPTIIDTAESYIEDHETDADHPADIADIKADAYHKLDDPRDFAPTWEERQPEEFRDQIARIRNAKTFHEVKAVGGSFFNDRDTKAIVDSFTKTQRTVLWDEYHRAKNRLAPKLRPLALKALERMTDKKVDLSKVAAWLHGEGKQRLNEHELSVVWDAWKKAKKAYAPKQTALDMPEIPLEYYVE
jgi:hypothetical protein